MSDHLAVSAGLGADSSLPDEGANAVVEEDTIVLGSGMTETDQCFVKFFGSNSTRVDRSMSVQEEVRRSGCHWACSYPDGKRPRQVRDGALMFMSRLVKEPQDIIIFGRATALSHQPGRDDATPEDKAFRPWKEKWPHYARVHQAEFIAGTLEKGISLADLMDHLKSEAFVSTQRNARKGSGNTNPRAAYRRQPSVALTAEATLWMNEAFEAALQRYGKLSTEAVTQRDRPDIQLEMT